MADDKQSQHHHHGWIAVKFIKDKDALPGINMNEGGKIMEGGGEQPIAEEFNVKGGK